MQVKSFDKRRDIVIAGNLEETIDYSVEHFIYAAMDTISYQGYFSVALSGGSTPKAIFKKLLEHEDRTKINWKKVLVFWSDERCVLPTDPDSNYKMAMDSGLGKLIPEENFYRMQGEKTPEEGAKDYDYQVLKEIPNAIFDLVMLGMGEDGHTASLFPNTEALHANDKFVVANYVPQKEAWRLTMTYKCINAAKNIVVYVMGKQKADMVAKVFKSPYDPDIYPVQKIGTESHKALWILDRDAASLLGKF